MEHLLTDNLYDQVLVNPLLRSEYLNRLIILSGYATSAMSYHYLHDITDKIKEIQRTFKLDLLVGMASKDGISESNHNGFKLLSNDFERQFGCRYIFKKAPSVHSKIYIWCKDDTPQIAFAGSANYTQNAFLLNNQREVMTLCDPESSMSYYLSLISSSINCDSPDANSVVELYEKQRQKKNSFIDPSKSLRGVTSKNRILGLPSMVVNLTTNKGEVPLRSGLNWGQREKREPNQAYINLKAPVYKSDFFPPLKIHFTVLTDDGETFICSRAQQNGKGIHTPYSNSILGRYFRKRLGVSEGARVTTEDLLRYGRTNVDFYKIDDESYYMDFSVKNN